MAHVHTFAGGPFDRAGHLRRDEAWLAPQLQHPEARFLPLRQLNVLMRSDSGLSIGWRGPDEMRPFLERDAMTVLLGLKQGVPHFAVDISTHDAEDAETPFKDAGKFIDVRSAAMQCEGAEAAVLAQSRSLIDWHARHGFCAVCGQPTEPKEAGYMRQCTDQACNAQHFPRTDPVVIMLVFDGPRILLGRQAHFPPGVYSALAGFVEPGENIEEGVRREIMEEAQIKVGRVRYHSSQPWPFPSSLMIGCFADAESNDIHLDRAELEDARWYSRDELQAMVENWNDLNAVRMPPPLSIAHQLAHGYLRGD